MGRPISARGFRISGLLILLSMTLWWAREQRSSERVASVHSAPGIEGRSTDRGRVEISADGRTVAGAGYDHAVRVWRGEDLWRVLPGSEVYLAGNEWVLTRSDQTFDKISGIGVWSLEESDLGRRLATDRVVRHLAVSADGEDVFVGTSEGRVARLEIRSGETFWELPEDSSRQWMRGLMALSEERLAIFGRSELQVWNPVTETLHCSAPFDQELYVWEGNGSNSALLFDSLERVFAAWDLESCDQVLEIEGFSARSPAALSADGRYLALADEQGQVGLWDLAEDQTLASPEVGVEHITSLRFHPNRHAIFVTGAKGELRLLPLQGGTVRKFDSSRAPGRSRFTLADVSAGGRWVVGTNAAGNLEVLDLAHRTRGYELENPARKIQRLAWSDNGEVLFVGTRFNGLTTFDFSRGTVMDYGASGNRRGPLGGFVSGGGGKWLAASNHDGNVELFRTGEDSPYAELRGADAEAKDRTGHESVLAVGPSGQKLATASTAGPVSIWDGSNGHRIFTLENPIRALGTLGFSSDGRYLLGYGMDARLVIWRLDRRLLVEVLEPVHSWPSLLFPNDHGWRTNLRERPFWMLWIRGAEPAFFLPLLPLVQTGNGPSEEIVGLDPHHRLAVFDRDLQTVWSSADERGRGLGFAVSADGTEMALGTHEPAIEVYDRQTRVLTERIPGHRSGVQALAWSPDGRYLASGDLDGVVHLRDGHDHRLLARIFLSCRQGWVVAAPDGRWDADGSRCSRQRLGIHSEREIEPLRFDHERRETGFWRDLGSRYQPIRE